MSDSEVRLYHFGMWVEFDSLRSCILFEKDFNGDLIFSVSLRRGEESAGPWEELFLGDLALIKRGWDSNDIAAYAPAKSQNMSFGQLIGFLAEHKIELIPNEFTKFCREMKKRESGRPMPADMPVPGKFSVYLRQDIEDITMNAASYCGFARRLFHRKLEK